MSVGVCVYISEYSMGQARLHVGVWGVGCDNLGLFVVSSSQQNPEKVGKMITADADLTLRFHKCIFIFYHSYISKIWSAK